jgi:hypothetical protein
MARIHVIAQNARLSEHARSPRRQKVIAELVGTFATFLFLALFFEAFALYRMLLLREYRVEYFTYAAPLVSALILAKVIVIGDAVGLGRRFEEEWPLIVSTLYKAFVFGLLAAVFHVLEEAVRALLHHQALAGFRTATGGYELMARALVLFSVFVPFFAFRETHRVLGGSRLYQLFFRKRSKTPELPNDLGQPA